ncbi:hypothetical protein MTO96_035646 [Rhipicephalus appendiculatus]
MRHPTKPTFDTCGCPRSDVAGCHSGAVNPSSDGVPSSAVLQMHAVATNVAPEFTATSVDLAGLTTTDSSCKHQPLQKLAAEAALAKEAALPETSTLQYFLIANTGLAIAAVSSSAETLRGPLATHGLLPGEKRRPAHHPSCPS